VTTSTAGSLTSLTGTATTRCLACSYQVHGLGARGGQHPEFATDKRPNDRCSGCSGCT
jgi:hypothetical protein